MSGKWTSRLVAAALATGATLIVFWLWATFGTTLMRAMSVPWVDPNAPRQSDDGAYTVNVLPVPAPCPKDASPSAHGTKPCPR
ncbi:MAG: hypothetical protein ACREHE_15070 [Rhizomicrobium sp.]